MNVMEIVSGATVNGAVQHCLLLTRELARREHRLTLVCWPGSWIAGQAAKSSIEVVPSDLHRWPADELRRIARLAQERQIDVVHTHLSRAHFFGVLLRWFSGIPVVATAHSRHFQLHWMFNDLVIAVSEATRHYHHWRNLVPWRRIVTIRNFIDEERVAAVPAETRARMRAALGLDQDAALIGTVGDVIPRKGVLYLVRALPQIAAAEPRVRLVVAGKEGPPGYMDELKATADRLGVAPRILWLGHRDDVPDLLGALDLLVHPSLEEPLGLAILEAMMAELPVVATTVGGIPECVRPGETGLLIPPANSEALAEAVLTLLTDPDRRRAFGLAGRRWVLDQFCLDRQAARIESALAATAQGARAA